MQPAAILAFIAILTTVGGAGHADRPKKGPGVANVFLSTSGNDSGANCRRFPAASTAPSPSSACGTSAKALSLARPGDVVQLLPGSYADLTLSRQSGSDSPRVTVRGDVNLPRQPACAAGCAPGDVAVSDLTVCGHGLSIRDIDSTGVYDYVYVGSSRCPGSNQVVANHDIDLVNVHFNAGTLRGHDLVLRGSRIGPNAHICDDPASREDNLHLWPDPGSTPWTAPYEITLDGNLIYDAEMTTPGCGGAHSDLVQTLGYSNLTIQNNSFWRCGHSFWQDGVFGGTVIGGTNVFRNNFFGGPCSAPRGGSTQLGSGDAASCSSARFAIEGNTWATTSNVLLNCPGSSGNIWRNNFLHIGSSAATTCGSGTWDHNAFEPGGITCGDHARRCSPKWRYPSAGTADLVHGPDLHIAAGDTCLRNAASAAEGASLKRDIDGDLRPMRSPGDAGADQYETAQINVGSSIGQVSLGMNRSSVIRFYGQPRSTTTSRLARGARAIQLSRYRLHGGTLWVAYDSGRVIGIGTSSAFYSTSDGAGVKAPLASIPQTLHASRLRCGFAEVVATDKTLTTFASSGRRATKVTSVSIIRRPFATPISCKR